MFIPSEWDVNPFSQLAVTISDMVLMVMVDDIDKELILMALLWKQSPWKPPWKMCIKDGELQDDGHSHNHNWELSMVMQPQRYSMLLKIIIQDFYWWFFTGDSISLVYGDIFRIVEDWQILLLFLLRKSIKWIFSNRISIDPIWNLANVIHQRNLKRRIWNFIEKMVAKYKWCYIRNNKKIQKKISSVLTLCVVMIYSFSFAFNCNSSILYAFAVSLLFI